MEQFIDEVNRGPWREKGVQVISPRRTAYLNVLPLEPSGFELIHRLTLKYKLLGSVKQTMQMIMYTSPHSQTDDRTLDKGPGHEEPQQAIQRPLASDPKPAAQIVGQVSSRTEIIAVLFSRVFVIPLLRTGLRCFPTFFGLDTGILHWNGREIGIFIRALSLFAFDLNNSIDTSVGFHDHEMDS